MTTGIPNLMRAATLSIGLLTVLLTGCGSDDPAAPAPEPAPMVEVTWRADRLNVILDGDASGGPGDFYLSFTLSDYTSGDEVILAERRRVLVQRNSQEIAHSNEIDIALRAPVALKDGTRLLLNMSFYENDPDGPQASIGNAWYYTYSTVSGSWESEDDDRAMEFGKPTFETLQLEDYTGDDLNAYLRGRFSMDVIPE